MFDWLTAALVAYPFCIAIGAMLAKEPSRFGGPYWIWTLTVTLPVSFLLWCLALGWPWWGAVLYFGGTFALGVFGKTMRNFVEAK